MNKQKIFLASLLIADLIVVILGNTSASRHLPPTLDYIFWGLASLVVIATTVTIIMWKNKKWDFFIGRFFVSLINFIIVIIAALILTFVFNYLK